VVWTLDADRGSKPARFTAVVGQTALVRLRSRALRAPFELVVEPPEAEVTVDGVRVPKDAWHRRLPEGRHEIEVTAIGYRSQRTAMEAPVVHITLARDTDHPRWSEERERRWAPLVTMALGYPIFDSAAMGFETPRGWVAVRGGLERRGFALETELGALRLPSVFSQRDYALDYGAAQLMVGGSARMVLTGGLAVVPRLLLGAQLAMDTPNPSRDAALSWALRFELGLDYAIGQARIGAGAAFLLSLLGPHVMPVLSLTQTF
jgi:hypothetical protein